MGEKDKREEAEGLKEIKGGREKGEKEGEKEVERAKLKSKWIKELNMNPDTLNL